MPRSPAHHTDLPTTAEQLLAAARATLRGSARRTPTPPCATAPTSSTFAPTDQRRADGLIPGARVVARNALEWRLDPACPYRDPELTRGEGLLVLICDEGFQSSLAAATIQRFGPRPVTDVIGGFCAWRAAGLPVQNGP